MSIYSNKLHLTNYKGTMSMILSIITFVDYVTVACMDIFTLKEKSNYIHVI
jgi:hypothetical protein